MFHLLSGHSLRSPALGTFSSTFLGGWLLLSLEKQKYEEQPTRNFLWHNVISRFFFWLTLLFPLQMSQIHHYGLAEINYNVWLPLKTSFIIIFSSSNSISSCNRPFQAPSIFMVFPSVLWSNYVSSAGRILFIKQLVSERIVYSQDMLCPLAIKTVILPCKYESTVCVFFNYVCLGAHVLIRWDLRQFAIIRLCSH